MPPKKKTRAASPADEDNRESDGYVSASDSASSVDSTMVGDQDIAILNHLINTLA